MGLSRALADGRCSGSAGCSNATATSDRPIYTDSARDREGLHERSRSLRRESKREGFRSENEEDDDEDLKKLGKRITNRPFCSSKGLDNRKVNRTEEIGRAEGFFRKVLRENVSEGCDKLLRSIKESQSLLLKRSIYRKKDVQRDSSSLKKDIREEALLLVEGQALISEEETTKRSLEENSKKRSRLLVKKEDIQGSSSPLKQEIQDSSLLLKSDAREEALLVERSDATSVKNNYQDSLSYPKKEGTNKNVHKSFLLPKTDSEELLTQKDIGKDLAKKHLLNETSRLTKKTVEETKLSSANLTRNDLEKSQRPIEKNDDSSNKNTLINPLMQLTKTDIHKNLEISRDIFEEKLFLVKENSEESSQLTVQSSLLSQKEDIPNDPQLQITDRTVQYNSSLTKNLSSLVREEKNIPESSPSRLIDKNLQEKSSRTENLRSPVREVTSSAEKEEDICDEDSPSQLIGNITRNGHLLMKNSYSLAAEGISLAEKEKELSQSTERIVQNDPSLKNSSLKNFCSSIGDNQAAPVRPLRHKQARRDSTDVLCQSSIVHKRYFPSTNSRQTLQESEKVRIEERNSAYKLKRSPPPEENWPGRGSSESDNSRSFDKHDSSVVTKCRLVDSTCNAKRQSIAKPAEEYIPIFKISRGKDIVNIFEENSETSAESIENVSERSDLEEEDSTKNLKNPIIKINNSTEKTPLFEIEKPSEELRKLDFITVKDSENILTSVSTKINIRSLPLKIINSIESSHNPRLIQKSSSPADRQPSDLRLPLIEQRLLKGEKRSGSPDRRPHKSFKMKLIVKLIRIRDKVVLGLSAFAILFTLLLVMDLQMDLGYSGHHLTPSHARVRVGDPPDADTVYNNFRRKFLQRANGSREQANSDSTPVVEKSGKSETIPPTTTMKKHDDFADLVELVVNRFGANFDEGVVRVSGENHAYNPTIADVRKMAAR